MSNETAMACKINYLITGGVMSVCLIAGCFVRRRRAQRRSTPRYMRHVSKPNSGKIPLPALQSPSSNVYYTMFTSPSDAAITINKSMVEFRTHAHTRSDHLRTWIFRKDSPRSNQLLTSKTAFCSHATLSFRDTVVVLASTGDIVHAISFVSSGTWHKRYAMINP